jgi:hypothetical protein
LVEKHVPSREIGAAVTAIWDLGQLVKALEEFGHYPVRRLAALLLQEVKPDGVNIEDQSKISQSEFFAKRVCFNAASFRRASSGL